jgi:hypothetical protein
MKGRIVNQSKQGYPEYGAEASAGIYNSYKLI